MRAGLRSKFFIPKTCELVHVGIHTQIQKKNSQGVISIFAHSPFFAVWPIRPPHFRVAGISLDKARIAAQNISPVPEKFESKITSSHKSIRSSTNGCRKELI